MTLNPLRKHIRKDGLPHFFCSGCGAAQVLNFFLRAADAVGLDFDRLVAIGGVGCAARIPIYLDAEALHGVHGRTLPWATGIKLMKPELEVVIFAGDGDAASIGGNHLIHAARRNLDVTFVVVNNLTFGMTGGQVAPTTPLGLKTSTTPYGNREKPFDICRLALSAGATYVSRWTTAKPRRAIKALKGALNHRGFALVEIITQCPTNFGRKAIGSGDPLVGLQWIDNRSVMAKDAAALENPRYSENFLLGDFAAREEPCFRGGSLLSDGEGR
jgi:2-oxoglutarate ferredoxin oxidoreductase subunit beta